MTTQGLEEESASKLSALRETVSGLARSCELPMSVCFNAVREEAYVGGGEEYLTFREAIQNPKTPKPQNPTSEFKVKRCKKTII